MTFYIFEFSFDKQEKDSYRWAIKETIKSMLAFGWTIERTKEGDAFGIHACARRVSQAGQVCLLPGHINLLTSAVKASNHFLSF